MIHSSEGQHWYSRTGEPVYEVPRADGKGFRSATLADARKLLLVPGVSGILSCAAKPGLINWQIQQAIHAALTLPIIDGESEETYLARILQDSKEQARKAAERGTAIHAAIQGHYEGTLAGADYQEHFTFIRATVDAIRERFGEQNWVSERSFACHLGYGGKIDLHCDIVLLDFKTKEFEKPIPKLAWPEHAMQLVAYNMGINVIRMKCANVFISTKIPGLVHIHEWDNPSLVVAWSKFQALLDFWQADRNYNSSFSKEYMFS